jgi:hypothetical protein
MVKFGDIARAKRNIGSRKNEKGMRRWSIEDRENMPEI